MLERTWLSVFVLGWEFIVRIRSITVSDYPAFVTIGQLPDVFNGHCPEIAIYAASCPCVDICNTNTSNGCTVAGRVTGWLSCRTSRQFSLSLRIGRFSSPFRVRTQSKKALTFCWGFKHTSQLLIQIQDLEHSTTVAQLNSAKEKREQQRKRIQCAPDTYYVCTVDPRLQRECRVVRKSRAERMQLPTWIHVVRGAARTLKCRLCNSGVVPEFFFFTLGVRATGPPPPCLRSCYCVYRVYVKQLLAALYTQVWLWGQLLQATLRRQYGGMETDNN